MSRPSHTVTDARVRIEVPPLWMVTVSAISRRDYNQVVLCAITDSDDDEPNNIYFQSKFGTQNEVMKRGLNGEKSLPIFEKDENWTLDFSFYHSQDQSLGYVQLAQRRYESSKANALTSSRPREAVAKTADYVTFLIFVEDTPNGAAPGAGQYSDALVAVHCVSKNAESKFNLANIQGDVVPGLPKNIHYLYFFEITNIPNFRRTVRDVVLPRVTTAQKVKSTADKNQLVGLNMSFSSIGLSKLGLTESLQDESFEKGQLFDAQSLGDSGIQRGGHWTPNWDSEFKADIHGVFLVTAHPETEKEAEDLIKRLDASFVPDVRRASLKKILLVRGSLRPGNNKPNDFFGFRDGISKPEIEDVTFSKNEPMRYTGSSVVDMGVIVMGHDGDEDRARRPSWAVDGSFMVFRKLRMFAPEFKGFVRRDSAKVFPTLDPTKAQDLYGARLVGRWKSGTPIVLSPHQDDLSIANDDKRVNNFNYDHLTDQTQCPFAVHSRKSNPRTEPSKKHLFRRQSLPYGPEVHGDEQETYDDRGLHFVCYQSSIVRGFKYVQQTWYNNPKWPAERPTQSGYDPLLGQTGREHLSDHRFITGVNPNAQSERITFPTQFVHPSGGEYFFVPSIATLTAIAN